MFMHDSHKYRYALLIMLSGIDGEWMPLAGTMSEAREMAVSNYAMRDIAISTMKKVRKDCEYLGLLEVRREPGGRHWEIRITDKGEALAATLPRSHDNRRKESKASLPKIPFRVGQGHLMPAKVWKSLAEAIQSGDIDIVAIPHDQNTKTGYWDA
jgi:hypothetical protein